MSRWKVKAPALLVLSMVVFFMLVIVVLPEVDLPATAFHEGTAPLALHARARAVPPIIAVAALFQFPPIIHFWHPVQDVQLVATSQDPNFRPILLRSIRR
jgi:hypothetical protein